MTTALVWLLGAFVVSAIAFPPYIRFLRESGVLTFHWLKQDIDNRAFYELHQKKTGTPSMGGTVMVVITVIAAAIVLSGAARLASLVALVPLALLGLADDITKLLVRSGRVKRDLAAKPKLVAQWLAAIAVGAILYANGF